MRDAIAVRNRNSQKCRSDMPFLKIALQAIASFKPLSSKCYLPVISTRCRSLEGDFGGRAIRFSDMLHKI
jgi:hypothetical protein